jgi:glutamine synthetase
MLFFAEYIWLDGASPTKMLRCKARVLKRNSASEVTIENFPQWNFDGSSTYQSPGHKSDLVLRPVSFVKDPTRPGENYLVMCEVFEQDGQVVPTNSRSVLRHWLDQGGAEHDVWLGFEQEYTFFQNGWPLGWPTDGFPKPQGPYFCGVGTDRVFGREIVEEHAQLCVDAGLMFFGINAEVMASQWEFQVGHRGFEGEIAHPLLVSDHLIFARFLLHKTAEKYGVVVNFDSKPMKGDWNGAGAHTNFSTKAMRDKTTGWAAIESFAEALREVHHEHIAVYGHGLEDRLTGLHETCDINTFKYGNSDRGASVRIPHSVAQERCGYIEDRRPGANCDPYLVAGKLVETLVKSQGGRG